MTAPFDWAVFDGLDESECECSCGATFKSHARYDARLGLLSRKMCPGCGGPPKGRLVRVSSSTGPARAPAEKMTIGPEDVGTIDAALLGAKR